MNVLQCCHRKVGQNMFFFKLGLMLSQTRGWVLWEESLRCKFSEGLERAPTYYGRTSIIRISDALEVFEVQKNILCGEGEIKCG